jgi:hypothetical protein
MIDPLLDGIKTDAGKELITYINQYYGSSVWGRVIEGVKAIEKELE